MESAVNAARFLPVQTDVGEFVVSTRRLPGPDGCGRLWETVIIRAGEYLDETEERTKTEAQARHAHELYVNVLRMLG